MTLINLKDALGHAVAEGYAIGAFNYVGEDMLYGILDAAVREQSPVIVSLYEGHLPYVRWESYMKLVLAEADSVDVPVVVFLDHASTLEVIYWSIKYGFTSIMYDGSALDYDQNIENAKNICQIAHALDISVEGELGKISRVERVSNVSNNRRDFMTDPDLVPDFIARTGVDALAVSIGTVHGYFTGKSEIDFELLQMIHERTSTPLVLHGGTGLKDEEFLKAIANGVRKINYGTDIFGVSAKKARKMFVDDPELLSFQDVCLGVREAVADRAAYYMRLWGSSGKSWL